ncbi:MFS general substrate transporter [Mycena floridula]|nr:MFS general substrate transporter [Mycena floridula]
MEKIPDVYDRFSASRKRIIVFVVAFAALLAPFASSSFLPSIPQIAHDLNTTDDIIAYSVAVYLVVIAISPLGWSSCATFYGRRPVYLLSIPIFVGASIGVAESRTLTQLMITRILQGIGSSSVLSVGAGSIGDIYRPTERGGAMGWYLAGVQFGPPLAPLVGGLMTQYAPGSRGSWRALQYLLVGMGAATFILCVIFLPETSHSRGVDKARKEGRKGVFGSSFFVLNPLVPLRILKDRNALLITFTSSFILLATYSLIVPLSYTMGPRFRINNVAILGTFYLAQGAGNMVGSKVSGYLSDRAVRAGMSRRNGIFIFEDRLYASIWAGLIFTPLSILGAGLTIQFWTNWAGLAVSLLFLFINGVSLMCVLAVCNTYLVDCYQLRSVEAIATNKSSFSSLLLSFLELMDALHSCLRYIFSAGASAAVLPLIKVAGIAPTNAIAAVFTWVGAGFVLLVIQNGARWRGIIDSKAPTIVDEENIDEKTGNDSNEMPSYE